MYEKSLEFFQNDDIAYYNLGALAYEQNDLENAKINFARSVQINQKNLSALFALGEVHKKGKKCKLAKLLYTRVLKLQPKALLAHFRMGQCEIELGDTKAAARHLQAFVVGARVRNPWFWQKRLLTAKHYMTQIRRGGKKP